MNIDKFNERLNLRGVSILTANKPRRTHIDTVLPKKINVVFDMPNLWNKTMEEQLEGLLKSEDFQLKGFLGTLGEFETNLNCLYIPNSWAKNVLEIGDELKYELQCNLRFFGDYHIMGDDLNENVHFRDKDEKLLNGLSCLNEVNEKVRINQIGLRNEFACFMDKEEFVVFSNPKKCLSSFMDMIELLEDMPEYSDSNIQRLSDKYIARWTLIEKEIAESSAMF